MCEETRLTPEKRAEIAFRAESIMFAGLKCVVEVSEYPGARDGWGPRLALLSPDAPPERAIQAVEDTMRIWPTVGVRLAAYTPWRLRRVEDFPTHLCKDVPRLGTVATTGRAAA